MDLQKDNWHTFIMVGSGALGGIMGFITVYLLATVFGRFWGTIVAIILLASIAFLLYKVIIE